MHQLLRFAQGRASCLNFDYIPIMATGDREVRMLGAGELLVKFHISDLKDILTIFY